MILDTREKNMTVDGRISLVMIVKNEEANLGRCLESVKGIVDEIVVVDTGSTDATKIIADSFNAVVYDFTWSNDFSAARNFGLEKATGAIRLILDADEYMLLVQEMIYFKQLSKTVLEKLLS